MGGVLEFSAAMLAIFGAAGLAASGVMLARAFSKRIEAGRPDRALLAELDELRAQVAELQGLPTRVEELEERLDFAERLLANPREPGQIGPGSLH